ncbi:hypothetical protein AVEN_29621-1 [Araneus ventricosus]|uniref:Histone-lysine N-methyltransferase SETMAR n=1 Tax=Araneus ventricosus TaxID=182803 RepID=A0A4Y2I9L4_ARAVE|nr:hypothetical protein AVEN_29621-1 [Araneus ventricosus]
MGGKFKCDVFEHPPYIPDFAPSDFHLFTAMKKWLERQHFSDDEELENAVTHCLKSQVAAFHAEGIGKTKPKAQCQKRIGIKRVKNIGRDQYRYEALSVIQGQIAVTRGAHSA